MSGLHGPVTFAEVLTSALQRYPDRTAFAAGGTVWSYAEVSGIVARLAWVLTEAGAGPGRGVASLSANRPEAWFLHAAALVAGARWTPLHPLSSLEDQAYVCSDAEISLLAFDPQRFEARAVALRDAVPGMRLGSLGPSTESRDLIADAESAAGAITSPVPSEQDLAWIVYTGGTTGRPKGVMLPHRCLVQNAYLTAMDMQWPDETRFLVCMPMSHSAGTFIVPTLMKGGSVHTVSHFDADEFCDVVRRDRITAVLLVPSAIYRLLEHPDFNGERLPSLRSVFYGSAPMSPARMGDALDRFGQIFNQLFGQAEAPNTITVLRKEEHLKDRPDRLASCGKPFTGVRVQLMDLSDEPVTAGEAGEICVQGPLVMDGYWKRPEQTAEALRSGWLHTGDVGIRDAEGYITIVDRLKDMIISGGFNVYPREVEDVLTRHPAVGTAAVIGVPDERWGEAVTACVVLKQSATATAAELIEFVKAHKGSVHAPKSVHFVESIPLTPVGKADKKALRQQFWSGYERAVHY